MALPHNFCPTFGEHFSLAGGLDSVTSQTDNVFDEGLSKDNLLQSDDEKSVKRNEQSDPLDPTAHSIKTTQTTNFFSAGLSMNILVRLTGLEPARSPSGT